MVSSISETVSNLADSIAAANGNGGGAGDLGDDAGVDDEEWITLAESASYLGPLLKFLAIAHSLLSMSMLVAYYFLKVSFSNIKGGLKHLVFVFRGLTTLLCRAVVFFISNTTNNWLVSS